MPASSKKLTVPRATRVDEDIARELLLLTEAEDLKPAEVDRLPLWTAEALRFAQGDKLQAAVGWARSIWT